MPTPVLALLLFNAAALAGLLAMARFSVRLVDEDGRPLSRANTWQERVIAPAAATATETVTAA